ncbi:MAG: hypothetical protein A2261_01935 [Candidatus Magasanikbacteria bacterium RIFOXYA2_FULL_44_8]|uniref:DNA alkylation repair protein n=1 Tax=Candidatus Magasanikbacteria bacterium RIFOXYA2_FULL_44_8 TaxID=1798696 RepID=A0A1F6NKV7_9BACT|nr:MAG: hypothetical protein A2261_01935 [Candidatus Magasanikbacteria bacterium RIFOXYA2_FULL_44_8]
MQDIMTSNLSSLKSEITHLANPAKAKLLAGFFKTGSGQYGAGDKFLGIVVPQQRQLVKKYFREITVGEAEKLLYSPYHEIRLTALLILVAKFAKTDEIEQKKIYDAYLHNTKYINNWDLVDLSAPNIVGTWLLSQNHPSDSHLPASKRKKLISNQILYKLVQSKSLWERRIAILATFAFIRAKQFTDAIKIAEILLHDKHDLIHKAVGWMLREIGKRDEKELTKFLDKFAPQMPRTMLRYAIEKFPKNKRKRYLNIKPVGKNNI